MKKKPLTQREKLAAWEKTVAITTSPEEFRGLVSWLSDPEGLLGVTHATIERWKAGKSPIPFAAAQLLRLLHNGMPKCFGVFTGWRFLPDGNIYPDGWGEPISRDDVINSWFWREQATHVRDVENKCLRLMKENSAFREMIKTQSALNAVYALDALMQEKSKGQS